MWCWLQEPRAPRGAPRIRRSSHRPDQAGRPVRHHLDGVARWTLVGTCRATLWDVVHQAPLVLRRGDEAISLRPPHLARCDCGARFHCALASRCRSDQQQPSRPARAGAGRPRRPRWQQGRNRRRRVVRVSSAQLPRLELSAEARRHLRPRAERAIITRHAFPFSLTGLPSSSLNTRSVPRQLRQARTSNGLERGLNKRGLEKTAEMPTCVMASARQAASACGVVSPQPCTPPPCPCPSMWPSVPHPLGSHAPSALRPPNTCDRTPNVAHPAPARGEPEQLTSQRPASVRAGCGDEGRRCSYPTAAPRGWEPLRPHSAHLHHAMPVTGSAASSQGSRCGGGSGAASAAAWSGSSST